MSLRSSIKRALRPVVRTSAAVPRSLPPSLWGLCATASGTLALGLHDLEDLAMRYGTPLHVLDTSRLRSNIEELDGLDVFYSYKTHPLPAILKRLHELGAGAEVISEMELDLALHLGVPAGRIIYNGPAKSERSLRTAISRRILLLNLNHREELPRVVQISRETGCRARLGIRVNTSAGWSAQFGTPIAGGAALSLFEEVLSIADIELAGLHSHRGELIHNAQDLDAFLEELLKFADILHARFGWSPEILDLGGSLAIRTVQPLSSLDIRRSQTFGVEIGGPDVDAQLTIREYAAAIRTKVTEHYRRAGRPAPRTVVELGRALTGNAQLLMTRVVTTREPAEGPATALTMAVLDAGINLASILRHERHQIFMASRPATSRSQLYRLVGPICQPGDVISNSVMLPELHDGDLLAIMDSGAYFEPDSTAFSFPRPGTLAVTGSEVHLARRAETLGDVISRDTVY